MALINCPECGKEFSEFSKQCPHCGIPTEQIKLIECSACGTKNRETAKYCKKCGKHFDKEEVKNSKGSVIQSQNMSHDDNSTIDDYYKEEFKKIWDSNEKYKGKWNWAAFSFTGLWALTKGLWVSALICISLSIFTAGIAIVIYWFYYGLRGNYLYYNKCIKKKQLPF